MGWRVEERGEEWGEVERGEELGSAVEDRGEEVRKLEEERGEEEEEPNGVFRGEVQGDL